MEASETRKARLPFLSSRVFNRSLKEGFDTSISPVTVQYTSKYHYQASEMLGRTPQPPPNSVSQALLLPLPAEHGSACFPRLFKRQIHRLRSSKASKDIAPSATWTKTRSATSKRVIPRLRAPLSPLSRKPGSSSSSFCISSPICTTPTKESTSHVPDFRSPRAKQLPRLPSRLSEYTFASEAGVRAAPVESSNASSELVSVTSDCLVAEANKFLLGFPKEVTLAVPPKRRLRKIPPALPADDWELAEGAGVVSKHALKAEANIVSPVTLHHGLKDASEEKSDSLSDVFSNQEQDMTRQNAITGMPNTKVLVFGTNTVLPDDIVQAFIRTRVSPRRAARPSRTKASAAKCTGQPAMLDNEIVHTAANEDEHTSNVQTVTADNLSPHPSTSGYRSEDTPTYATTPALSAADSASIYSCSSAAYFTNDDVTVAVSSPNESDLDGKSLEIILNEAKDQIERLQTVGSSPRQLVARSFPSGLSISIPLKIPSFRNAMVGDAVNSESLSMPEVTEVSNGPIVQLLHFDDPVEDQDAHCVTPSGIEDISLSSIETISTQRRSRRHGTVYGKHEPKVPFQPRCNDNLPSHLRSKPDTSTCTLVAHESGRPHANISYRADPRPGLRPLLLPRLLPRYHDQRNFRTALGPGSLPLLTPREDWASTSPTVCSPQSPIHNISGTSESEWSFVSISSPTELSNDGLPLLSPEHIKLRRSKSNARLLLAPGPAF